MRIAVLGTPTDPQVARVTEECHALGAEVLVVDADELGRRNKAVMIDGELLLDGVDYSDVRAVWVRSWPGLIAASAPTAGAMATEVRIDGRARHDLTLGWLCALHERGVRVVNPPRSSPHYVTQPEQLLRLRRANLDVPHTMFTTSKTAARVFRTRMGACVVRPMAQPGLALDYDSPEAQALLENLAGAPVQLQERVDGERLRMMLVGDEVVSAVTEEEAGLAATPGGLRVSASCYREARPSSAEQAMAIAAARTCGLLYACVELRRAGERTVLVECDSAPIYLDVELRLAHPISARLARYLVGGAGYAARRSSMLRLAAR